MYHFLGTKTFEIHVNICITVKGDLLLNISLVVGYSSVNISCALRVIYWATNQVRICFLNKI